MTPHSATVSGELRECPFCGNNLQTKVGKINPYGRCMTPNCYGAKMPVVSLDVPADVAAWNTRAAPPPDERSVAGVREIVAKTIALELGQDWEEDHSGFCKDAYYRYADAILTALSVPAVGGMDARLLDSCLEELTEGHLALDRLGAPREVDSDGAVQECLIAERIASISLRADATETKPIHSSDGGVESRNVSRGGSVCQPEAQGSTRAHSPNEQPVVAPGPSEAISRTDATEIGTAMRKITSLDDETEEDLRSGLSNGTRDDLSDADRAAIKRYRPKSPPPISSSLPSGESGPSVMPDSGGGGTDATGREAIAEWQPINTSPRNHQVLLWYPWTGHRGRETPDGFTYIGVFTSTECNPVDRWLDPVDFEDLGDGPSHWMPLPKPPADPATVQRAHLHDAERIPDAVTRPERGGDNGNI